MRLLFALLLVASSVADAKVSVPKVKIEYSYALDMFCPQNVVPETLKPLQLQLIPKIPIYREELFLKLGLIQSQWDKVGTKLLETTTQVIGKPFPMQDLQAAVFLCPRFPFMGTPLALNVISYLESPMKDLGKKASPIDFFLSTTFHEVLHKYIHDILDKHPSKILASLDETELFEAHLHLFAVQKLVLEKLGEPGLLKLKYIALLEESHGEDYKRAWDKVHGDKKLYEALLEELKK